MGSTYYFFTTNEYRDCELHLSFIFEAHPPLTPVLCLSIDVSTLYVVIFFFYCDARWAILFGVEIHKMM